MMDHISRGMCRGVLAGALLCAAGGAAWAAPVNVMTIGDSLTWGLTYDNGNPTTEGGWRTPLASRLTSETPYDFSFLGIKGDNNPTTVLGEQGGVNQGGDGYGGPGNTVALHEGYPGWYIDSTDIDETMVSSTQQGIRQNLRTVSNPTGTIDPGGLNSGPAADIVMLAIGVNDVARIEANETQPGVTVTDFVDNLLGLIAEINQAAPDATILVSNLVHFRPGSPFRDGVNDDIDDFNAQLLSYFDSGWLDDDPLDSLTDVYATSTLAGLENAVLLNAFSAIDPNSDLLDDNIHFNATGNTNMADFYFDRFVNGSVVAIPEPASLVLIGVGGLLLAARPRRRA